MGVVRSCCPFYIFGASPISQEWLKLELSNFVHTETIIKSCQRVINQSPKRGVVVFMWPIFACATVDLENGTPWSEVNNAVDGGPLLFTRRRQGCYTCILWRKLHRFDLLQQIDPVEFEPHRAHSCANNRQLSVFIAMCYRLTLIVWWLYSACSTIWSILHEAASCSPSAFVDIANLLVSHAAA